MSCRRESPFLFAHRRVLGCLFSFRGSFPYRFLLLLSFVFGLGSFFPLRSRLFFPLGSLVCGGLGSVSFSFSVSCWRVVCAGRVTFLCCFRVLFAFIVSGGAGCPSLVFSFSVSGWRGVVAAFPVPHEIMGGLAVVVRLFWCPVYSQSSIV